MRCLSVAFGMTGDELTKGHFGDSQYFRIYEICEDGSVKHIEDRVNTVDIEEEDDGHGDPRKFRAIIELLSDVDVLAAYAMGPNYLRIRDNSDKVPFITKIRDLESAIERVLKNFDKLWQEVQRKRSNTLRDRSSL